MIGWVEFVGPYRIITGRKKKAEAHTVDIILRYILVE